MITHPLILTLLGIGVLIYSVFFWIRGNYDRETNPLTNSDGSTGEVDKNRDADEFYFAFWAWVILGLLLSGYGLYEKFFQS